MANFHSKQKLCLSSNANFSDFTMLKQISEYDPERYGLPLSESYYNSLIPAVKAEEFAFWWKPWFLSELKIYQNLAKNTQNQKPTD